MLRIRMTRRGAKKDPHYRVVVTEKSSPRDGRFVEIIGYYNPAQEPVRLHLEMDRVDYWLDQGAQPTETVRTLIRRVREAKAKQLEAEVEEKAAREQKKAATAEREEDSETKATEDSEEEVEKQEA